jgi:hypothetical protein
MNGDKPKIEIFDPFGDAFEVMKRILLQPFDLKKWCVIGFAAFLSGSWSPGLNFNSFSNKDWSFRSSKYGHWPASDSMPWLIPLLIGLGVLILILVLVFMWIGARARFIFTDCVVRNRAAIVVPWREYRREGNSFFLFSLAVALLAIILIVGLVLIIAVPLGLFSGAHRVTHEFNALIVCAIVFVALVWVGFAIFFTLVTQFMVAVMYRRRCLAREAFVDISRLMLSRPGPFVLYVLFGIVLFLAFVIVSTVLTCVTCCIAGLPYVSSVVFLPALVWLLAFKLLFLRQFGPDYDVWATVDPSLPASSEPPSEALPTE